eukprot:gb/GECG01016135.1/.p1 GENE.gb/GECG01016135.1/~~gb/GECG01016135.1/.p1  ORF type:complete len:581 (+),score=35.98 gb/GECG01016135.1/:1-1743(+)
MVFAAFIRAIIAFFTPGRMVVLFTIINIINYMDRFIAPGAVTYIKRFISDELHEENVDAQFGVLQSAFIAGYAVASVTFGHLVHKFPPFKLMSVGLLIWCVAAILSGAAPLYSVLVVGRALSGVGEAAFQCVVPPFVDDNAPHKQRTLWLSVFYAAIPVGSAVGFGWGAAWATLTWRYAFYFEVPLMLPLVFLCWWFPFHRKTRKQTLLTDKLPGTRRQSITAGAIDDTFDAVEHRRHEGHDSVHVPEENQFLDPDASEEFWTEFKAVVSRPLFLLASFGYAGYAAVTAGFASFGAEVLQDMGIFSSPLQASLIFGGIVSFTGLLGAPLGGWLIDYHQKILVRRAQRREAVAGTSNSAYDYSTEVELASASDDQNDDNHSRPLIQEGEKSIMKDEVIDEDKLEEEATSLQALDLKLVTACPQIFLWTLIGAILCAVSVWMAKTKALFLFVFSLGCLGLFLSTSGVNLAIMASVPPRHRPFALGLGTIITHGFGDVPSPVAIGALSDQLSPEHCSDGHKDCTRSFKGLQLTIFIVSLWLFWPTMLWGVAGCLSYRFREQHIASGAYRREREEREARESEFG